MSGSTSRSLTQRSRTCLSRSGRSRTGALSTGTTSRWPWGSWSPGERSSKGSKMASLLSRRLSSAMASMRGSTPTLRMPRTCSRASSPQPLSKSPMRTLAESFTVWQGAKVLRSKFQPLVALLRRIITNGKRNSRKHSYPIRSPGAIK